MTIRASSLKTFTRLCLCLLTSVSARAQSIQPTDLVKHYTHYPVENGWHQVDIVLNGSNLRWTNSAGASWGLTLSNGVLQTQTDCPYGIQTVPLAVVVLADGSTQVRGLTFNSEFYKATLPLNPAYAKMIPLRDALYRKNDFCVSLSGPAISGTTPYEIFFDTGSWDTCIPYGAINTNNITVLQTNTTDSWGKPADLVQGTLALASADGTATYTLTNFVFFARLNAPDDRTASFGNSIMGAFPSLTPWAVSRPSFPFALAQQYSPTNNVGLGMVSEVLQNFQLSWACAKSYLQIGPNPQLTTNLNWRSDLPPMTGFTGYCPYRVPGFGITFSFSNAVPDLVVTGLTATVDCGAPELNMKIATNDPQRNAYSAYFTTNGPPWRTGTYAAQSRCLVGGQNVRVNFTSDTGKTIYYNYSSTDNFSAPPAPGIVIAGDWNSSVPWTVQTDFPPTRISLGNSIYFFCPVYFWDVSNNRVGISDFTGWRASRPRFSAINVSGTTLSFTVTNGTPGGVWTLLQSTDLTLPVSQWETNCTGLYDVNGQLTTNLLNTATNRIGFYLLK